MAHIHAFGDVAEAARPIIHLGATSQYVNDNTDLILMREALGLLIGTLANVIDALAAFAAEVPPPAVPGLHALSAGPAHHRGQAGGLWCNDFVMDLRELERRRDELEFLGVKGTTGTQASFLALFDGDHEKVKRLDAMVAEKMGFTRLCRVPGQTYSRKVDAAVAASLAGIGASVHKFCNDLRLLAAPQGDRGALRGRPGRLQRHALQAQPHAVRAGDGPGAVPDGPVGEPACTRRPSSGSSGRWTIPPTSAWPSRRCSWRPTRSC